MSRDIVPTCLGTSFHLTIAHVAGSRDWVQGQVTEQLTILGEHPHVEAIDQGENPGSDEPSSQPDVVQP